MTIEFCFFSTLVLFRRVKSYECPFLMFFLVFFLAVRRVEEERVNEGVPPQVEQANQGGKAPQGVQVSQGEKVPIVASLDMKNGEIREALFHRPSHNNSCE